MTESVPRLASDAHRGWSASAVGLTVSMVVTVLHLVSSGGGPFSLLVVYALGLLSFLLTFFVLYQVLTWRVFGRADARQLASWSSSTTTRGDRAAWSRAMSWEGGASWSAQAAVLSLVAVVLVSSLLVLRTNATVVVLSLLVVVASWVMVVIAYAVHYLRRNVEREGLEFPGQAPPVWSDYFYLSVQVSATFSTSDVTVLDTAMRREVTAHTLVAFVFNTVILALLVSALLTLP